MKNLKIAFISLSLIAFVFSLSSCDKATDKNLRDEITTPTDYSDLLGIMALDDLDDATNETSLKSALESSYLPCFEVTIHDNGTDEFWPRSWTFTYNQEDCICYFGNTKQGSVHISLTDFWKNENSLRTITYEDFFFNGNQIEGVRSILNAGLNENENLAFTRKFENAKITKPDTTSMSWETNCNVEMIAGKETHIFADDEYMLTGSASGVNYGGANFTATVTDPLYYTKCSFFPISGTLTIDAEGESTIVINYGEGECDNIATMTQDGVSTEITLGYNR